MKLLQEKDKEIGGKEKQELLTKLLSTVCIKAKQSRILQLHISLNNWKSHYQQMQTISAEEHKQTKTKELIQSLLKSKLSNLIHHLDSIRLRNQRKAFQLLCSIEEDQRSTYD